MSRGVSDGRICQHISHFVGMQSRHGQETCLLKLVSLYRRERCPESSHALCCIVPRQMVNLVFIACFVFKMREVEAISTICVQLQKARGDYSIFQIDCLATNVSFSLEDEPRLVRNDKVVFDELAIENIAAISEEGEPARHIRVRAQCSLSAHTWTSIAEIWCRWLVCPNQTMVRTVVRESSQVVPSRGEGWPAPRGADWPSDAMRVDVIGAW